MSSIWLCSTWVSPLVVLMKIGKNTNSATMSWFGRDETNPNQF